MTKEPVVDLQQEIDQDVDGDMLAEKLSRKNGLIDNIVEDGCPICSGLGMAVKWDEHGKPLTIRCLSCGFGSSGKAASNVAITWRVGADLFMRLSDTTFELAHAINMNRIATALEVLAATFAPDDDREPSE